MKQFVVEKTGRLGNSSPVEALPFAESVTDGAFDDAVDAAVIDDANAARAASKLLVAKNRLGGICPDRNSQKTYAVA